MFLQIERDLSEINTLNMIVFNFCIQQQIFMKPVH